GGIRADQPTVWPGDRSSTKISSSRPRTCIGRVSLIRPRSVRNRRSAGSPSRNSSVPLGTISLVPSPRTCSVSSDESPFSSSCVMSHSFGSQTAVHKPQFTNGEDVLLCNRACVGYATNDSAAACSMRTWFSICSNRTSIGTDQAGAGGTVGGAATRSEKKWAAASALTSDIAGCTAESDDSEWVAAPNATAAIPIPNTATHMPIKSISMAETLLQHFSLQHFLSHAVCQRWPRPNSFSFRRCGMRETAGLPECQVEPDYSAVVDGSSRVCHHPAISAPS